MFNITLLIVTCGLVVGIYTTISNKILSFRCITYFCRYVALKGPKFAYYECKDVSRNVYSDQHFSTIEKRTFHNLVHANVVHAMLLAGLCPRSSYSHSGDDFGQCTSRHLRKVSFQYHHEQSEILCVSLVLYICV